MPCASVGIVLTTQVYLLLLLQGSSHKPPPMFICPGSFLPGDGFPLLRAAPEPDTADVALFVLWCNSLQNLSSCWDLISL